MEGAKNNENFTVSVKNLENVTPQSSEEFAKKLEDKGFLSLDELYGSDWEERATSKNSVEIIQDAIGSKLLEILPLESNEDILSEKGKKLAKILDSIPSSVTEIVTSENEKGDVASYLLSTRQIKNIRGGLAFWHTELIDYENKFIINERDQNEYPGEELYSYRSMASYLSLLRLEGNGDINSIEVDLDALKGKDDTGYSSLSLGLSINERHLDDPLVRDVTTKLKGNTTSGAVITNIERFLEREHEKGHLAYLQAVPGLAENMLLAKRLFASNEAKGKHISAETARSLMSFNENAAWDVARKLLSWLEFKGFDVGLLDKTVTLSMIEQYNLLTYDLTPHSGHEINPAAFSNLMKSLREEHVKLGGKIRYDTYTGNKISHCPLYQLAEEGVDVKKLIHEEGLLPEKILQEVEKRTQK